MPSGEGPARLAAGFGSGEGMDREGGKRIYILEARTLGTDPPPWGRPVYRCFRAAAVPAVPAGYRAWRPGQGYEARVAGAGEIIYLAAMPVVSGCKDGMDTGGLAVKGGVPGTHLSCITDG